ncbi:Leucine carboxyl methyltransferase [Apiospora hydei]|uniref:Leucine carboxyl methyltransferase n=1 Tax=Apiospora hydei TaxID=1337664 RepID=A0ABR1WBK9_9PEZI
MSSTTTTTTTTTTATVTPPGSSAKIKVSLTGPQETLLVPLMARAEDAARPEPILGDRHAADILRRLDTDLAKFRAESPFGMGSRDMCLVRARQFDEWAAEFLAQHPRATVVHLACGLDTRCHRLDWASSGGGSDKETAPPPRPAPSHGDYTLAAADVTCDDWLRQIPTDRPTLILMEGLTPYFDEATGKRLVRRLAEHFSPTARPELPAHRHQLVCDGVGSAMKFFGGLLSITRATGSTFAWGFDDPRELERLHPRLRLRDCVRPAELAEARRFVWPHRVFMSTCSYIPKLDNLMFYLRYDF